jgi:hypothetical protein
MLPGLQQRRDLPALNVKRLQDLDELVDDQIASLPYKVYCMLAVVDAKGVKRAPDLLQRRLLTQPHACP